MKKIVAFVPVKLNNERLPGKNTKSFDGGKPLIEYILGTHKYNIIYRVLFSLIAYIGATTALDLVWNLSDIANALMAIPNLICMLLLSGEIAKDIREFQKEIHKYN